MFLIDIFLIIITFGCFEMECINNVVDYSGGSWVVTSSDVFECENGMDDGMHT